MQNHFPESDPRHHHWGIRFRFINDRGRVNIFKIASRNLTCLMQDCFREEHRRCSMIDYKIVVVISYKQYVPVGINSWKEFVGEYETEIDNCWFLEDALRSFRTYHLPKHGKILSIRKRFQEINKSWNHHHRTCGEIVL